MSWVETEEYRDNSMLSLAGCKILQKLVWSLRLGVGVIRTVLALCRANPVRFVLLQCIEEET